MLELENFNKISDRRLQHNYEVLLYYGKVFYNKVKIILNKNKKVFLLSGYQTSYSGHLITLYIEYTNNINNNEYKLTIINSGEGIETFHNKMNNKYQCIVELIINDA